MLHHRLAEQPIVRVRMDPRMIESVENALDAWRTFSQLKVNSLVDFNLSEFGSPWLDPGFFQKDRTSMPRIVYHYNLANELFLLAGSKYHLLKQFPEAKAFFSRARSLCKRIADIIASLYEEIGFRRYELEDYSKFTTLRFVRYNDNISAVTSRPHFDVGLLSVVLFTRNVTTEKWNGVSWEKLKKGPNEIIAFPGFQIFEASGGKVNPFVHREVLGDYERGGICVSAFIPHPECARFIKRRGHTQEDWAKQENLDIFP